MNETATFDAFFESIKLDSLNEYQNVLDCIGKKLNDSFYHIDSKNEHLIIVGSIGRGTAVPGTSDLDVLFDLPEDVFHTFDSYKSNGQSALLQKVKEAVKERYPKTDVRGDGQAVVISFESKNSTVDLVPAFRQTDGSFKYPDSHNGGSWKTTNPIPEQEACTTLFAQTDNAALHICNALRIWKNNVGFHFKGLLIDTLVGKYFDQKNSIPLNSYDLFIDVFENLSLVNRNQSYWHAIGSNQQVTNDDKGAFVPKSQKALNILRAASSESDREEALIKLFGKTIAKCMVDSIHQENERKFLKKYSITNNEEFIEDLFTIDISNYLEIDCKVTQDGWRTKSLRDMLSKHLPLLPRKQLDFHIVRCDVKSPYEIYWKVRNCGEEAFKRNCIRGQITEGTLDAPLREHADFQGPHFVECYAVKNGICVARSRIDVPISETGEII